MRQKLRASWKSHLSTVLLVLAVFLAVQAWQTRHVPGQAPLDVPWQVWQRDGTLQTQSLAEWRANHPGQPVALHFWAEWCPICKAEEGSISALQADWPVLTVAMQSGSVDQVRTVLQRRGLPWPTVVDGRGELARAFGVTSVPALVVLDANGRVRTPTVGYTTELGMRLRLWWAQNLAAGHERPVRSQS